MAVTLSFFMLPEDEVAFLRSLEPRKLQVYPEVCEPGYAPFLASAENASRFTDEAYYLAPLEAGDPVARVVRRGRNAGRMEIEEVSSPVFHYARSLMAEGELRSGRIWTELEVAGDRQHRAFKPDLLRVVFDEMRSYFKKRFHHSKPPGFFVGPLAARRANEGLVLREEGRKGGLVVPYR